MSDARTNPFGVCLDAGLATLIEASLHRLLAGDQRSLRRLERLEGKQLQLEVTLPPLMLVVRPHRDGISLAGHLEGTADCRVRATPAGLLRLLQADSALVGEGVEVSGETALAAELRAIVRELEIDWEGLLGDRIGDLLAHPLANALRRGRQWAEAGGDSLLDNLDNYLHEELAVVPAGPQLEQFYREVDQLRLAVDRLQARLERLQAAGEERTDDR